MSRSGIVAFGCGEINRGYLFRLGKLRDITVWFLHRTLVKTYVMPLDHAIQSLTIDSQHPRCCLLIAARVGQHARHVAPLNLRERGPFFFVLRRCRTCRASLELEAGRLMKIPDALRKIL